MPLYRIFRLRESDRQRFRNAPHTAGATMVKHRDYVEDGTVEAGTPYTAWAELKDSPNALIIGDVLVDEKDELRILKYIGFEEARWVIPEVKSGLEAVPPVVGQASWPVAAISGSSKA